ncbi:MAG: SufD family Fe-S cluster assembly protein [Fibrobacterota bacterium]|nr:SufD family Fe-S cluster assembly protein [Fibrobacterota bacterium]
MSESNTLAPATQFMRTVPVPELPQALEAAVPGWISGGDTALTEIRSAAFNALRKTGLPHSGSEDFSYIRVGEFLPHLGPPAAAALRGIAEGLPTPADIQGFLPPEARESYAVLVDGAYVSSLSKHPEDYQVISLAQGLASLPANLHALAVQTAAEETDAPAAMATLFARAPLLIQVPAKAVPAAPLLLLHIRTGSVDAANSKPGCVDPVNRSDAFIVIHAGKLSEARILVRHAVQSAGALKPSAGFMENVHTLALIEESASLKFMEAGSDEVGETAGNIPGFSARDIHFRKLTARLDRNGRLLAVSAHTGSRLTRNVFSVDLAGEGAEADVNGATVLTGASQSHNYLRIRHLVPQCVSRQHFKSVAADQSKSSVDGTIYVAKDAQQTNAYQLINNLMLSDEARADSKPRLMIYADDVKCSHGATSGKLDPAQQFYLESRGLPPVQARALLTVAFIAEVLEKSGKTGDGFRDGLDHALLDILRHRLPQGQVASSKPGEGSNHG